MKKKIISFLLTGVLCFQMVMPVAASSLDGVDFASGELPEEEELYVEQSDMTVSDNTIEETDAEPYMEVEDVEELSNVGTSALPAAYDSRKYGYITDIHEQRTFGTCWAFAATAAAEASLIKYGFADRSLDLSEYQLAYFTYRKNKDPLGNTDKDGRDVADIEYNLNKGGTGVYAVQQLAKWCGPISESKCSYQDAFAGIVPAAALAYQSDYHLKQAFWKSGMEMKELVYQYGAVASGFCKDADYGHNVDGTCNWYNPHNEPSDHSVCIIGWDDNYPKEKFKVRPEGNGAWLCKDSGVTNVDGDGDGYIWISYYNQMDAGIAFEFERAELLANNYQYDGDASDYSWLGSAFQSSAYTVKSGMNVFEAKRSKEYLEKLEAVSVAVNTSAGTFDVTVYVNPVFYDGKIVDYAYKSTPISRTVDCGGLYRIELPETVYLNEGDRFAVEVSGEIVGDIGMSEESEFMNPGESYVSAEKDGEIRYYDMYTGNRNPTPRIKAFTNPTTIPCASGISTDIKEKELEPGESFQIRANVTAPAGGMTDAVYTSSNPSVASVAEDGSVTANAPGECIITVEAAYGAAREYCKVKVSAKAKSLTTEPSLALHYGEEHKLAVVLDEKATVRNLKYESSSTSVASVSQDGVIKAVAPGTAVITVRTTDGSNLSAACQLTVKGATESLAITANTYISAGSMEYFNIIRVPEWVPDARLSFTSSNPSIAVVEGNYIKGIKAGKTVITVKALDSGVSTSIEVEVYGTAPDSDNNNSSGSNPNNTANNTATKNVIGTKFSIGDVKYQIISKDTVKFTGVKKKSIKRLYLPKTVWYKAKSYKVVEISTKACSGCNKLASVTIGANVKKIGDKAFYKCPIKKVTIPSNVTTIGSKAFYGCSKLKSITIKSKNLKTVGKSSFSKINKNVTIKVPKSKYSKYKKTTFKKSGLSKKTVWKKG